jgi:hypothetical protein
VVVEVLEQLAQVSLQIIIQLAVMVVLVYPLQ